MRIGLFGGSFNPIHNAHLKIAHEAMSGCSLDKVIFIPAADPPHKSVAGDVPFDVRAEMVAIAIAGKSYFEMSIIESERSGKSYSIDTINIFRQKYCEDELFFIIGGDSYLEISTWHRYSEIFSSCNIIVVERPGCHNENPLDALDRDTREAFCFDTQGVLRHSSGYAVYFVSGSPLDLSSTEIRQLAASGTDMENYLPKEVSAYISQQRIYQSCQ